MDNDALGKQIVNNILDLLRQYKETAEIIKKYNKDASMFQQFNVKNIINNIEKQMIGLVTSGNFNKNIMKVLIDGIKDQEFDVEFIKQILITDNVFNTNKSKSTLKKLKMIKDNLSSVLFGKDACNDGIIREITRQRLTLIAYNTKDGFKFTLCSPQNIDKTLSRILPNVVYYDNIKINNCAYHGVGYDEFCDKYICNTYNSSKFDIAIIPSISHNSVLQSSTAEDAKRQYKNVYEKIFKFFNNKNVPISLQQTSACKGNNFAFALSDNIEGDTKIDTLEFSTRNIISGMLIPNFHSKYVDTAVKCFYNQNINNLKICFTFPTPQELFLHAIPGSIGYATETISKILEKAENSNKDKQISVLNKILKSFDNTINILIGNKINNGFMTNNKIAVNDEQFLEKLKDIKTSIDNNKNIYQPFKEWIFTSIDEFAQQNPQNAISFTEILKNSKFYDEKKMSPTLAGFEVMETNKNRMQEFMAKHNITTEDLKETNINITNEVEEKKAELNKGNNINNSIAQANNASLADIMQALKEMQKEATYTKDQQQSNNIQSDISLQTLNDKNKQQETTK